MKLNKDIFFWFVDRLDKAFLRPGRMDKIIYVGLPSPDGRVEILKALTKVKYLIKKQKFSYFFTAVYLALILEL